MKKIKLTKERYAIIDDDDYEFVSSKSWSYSNGYARDGKGIFMHVYLCDTNEDEVVDHINRNKLDNRKSNLRKASVYQNGINKSKFSSNSSEYKGVSYHIRRNKWGAKITHKVYYNLGYFDTAEEAAKAYDEKAKELFGEYAYLNFPKTTRNTNHK